MRRPARDYTVMIMFQPPGLVPQQSRVVRVRAATTLCALLSALRTVEVGELIPRDAEIKGVSFL
jgi:hypothetical protein